MRKGQRQQYELAKKRRSERNEEVRCELVKGQKSEGATVLKDKGAKTKSKLAKMECKQK